MTLYPSACMWLFESPGKDSLQDVKQTAFHYIDLEMEGLGSATLEAVKELGLKVSCVAADRKLPAGCSLEGNDPGALRKAIDYIKQGLDRIQAAGASTAYVVSCRDRKNLKSFATALKEIADAAAPKGIRICVEHAPGRALATAREALTFVENAHHANIFLLLDTGHTMLSKEKAHEVILSAGKRLGYVQMNDNDGRNDRHWALLDGRLKCEDLEKIMAALQQVGYEGTLGLEVGNDRASVMSGLSRNHNLLLRLQMSEEPKSLKEPEARRKK